VKLFILRPLEHFCVFRFAYFHAFSSLVVVYEVEHVIGELIIFTEILERLLWLDIDFKHISVIMPDQNDDQDEELDTFYYYHHIVVKGHSRLAMIRHLLIFLLEIHQPIRLIAIS